MVFTLAKRLERLPPYLFAEIDKQKRMLRSQGKALLDLSIGDPDILAPGHVLDELYRAAQKKENQKYALDAGLVALREAIAVWCKRRFGITFDQNSQILPLLGSKEGLVHFPLAFVNRGDTILVPSPGYPGYRGACALSEARIYEMPLLEKNCFLPDLRKIPQSVLRRAKLVYLNYPNNPTTALAPKEFLSDLVKLCVKYGIIIAYDNAYSEVYFDQVPSSIFEIPGAEEVSIEFHSFSKTFCMTGFRLGWACGNAQLIQGLLKLKTNVDSGVFQAIQSAGKVALEREEEYTRVLRRTIRERRDLFVGFLADSGFGKIYADSTFYVWAKIPKKFSSSIEFSSLLLSRGIVATPGVGFGKYGEGFIRFALTVDKTILRKAKNLLRA